MSNSADYAGYLEDFIQSIENLPGEVHHLFSEIRERGQELQELKENMKDQDIQLRKLIRGNNKSLEIPVTETASPMQASQSVRGLLTEEQREVFDLIKNGFSEAALLSDEQIKVAERALGMIDRHLKRLTNDIDKMNEIEGLPPISSIPLPDIPVNENYIPNMISYEDSPSLGLSFISNGRSNHRPGTSRKGFKRRIFGTSDLSDGMIDDVNELDEQVYCFCQQVSYGEMIGCENGEECPFEWFHLECVGLSEPPTGIWYCPECNRKKKRTYA